MMATAVTKRQNFEVTPEQEAEISLLQQAFGVGSAKDAILKSVHLALVLAREVQDGKRICFIDHRRGGNITEVLLPELEKAHRTSWLYLVERSHSWKKQLFIKGRKLTAAQVWLEMQTNRMSPSDAAENWDLPLEAINEIVSYCQQNQALLHAEAEEERLHLLQNGVTLTR
jgi:hypothetical protein